MCWVPICGVVIYNFHRLIVLVANREIEADNVGDAGACPDLLQVHYNYSVKKRNDIYIFLYQESNKSHYILFTQKYKIEYFTLLKVINFVNLDGRS